ncbi:hypothetical protein [Microbulbifer hydrolyticus]|uniref:Zinc ribbon domain-containing protein n=1 Tax=Microbulbifer hydrolyticus TaxID=48074 RepID=A0A6P1T9I2_9GAMM|nr:hypothetical protein [Microbulbifer hydrolyticus]MBB5213125.1 hypothetical protein [Microbulbifer hydrolyticus]QHQ38667.1 hypothetical protein GTQ55_06470 [Microbulbifer hydrolyticus]
MNKGLCHICDRQIQNTGFDKCMYCGAELLENQKFTESEKALLADMRKSVETELRQKKAAQTGAPTSTDGFVGGLDFGFGDSSCD